MGIKIDTFSVVSPSHNIFHSLVPPLLKNPVSQYCPPPPGQTPLYMWNPTFWTTRKESFSSFCLWQAPPRTFWAPRNPKLPPVALSLNCHLGTALARSEVPPNLTSHSPQTVAPASAKRGVPGRDTGGCPEGGAPRRGQGWCGDRFGLICLIPGGHRKVFGKHLSLGKVAWLSAQKPQGREAASPGAKGRQSVMQGRSRCTRPYRRTGQRWAWRQPGCQEA